LNQQQLQTARAALWRQTGGTPPGPLVTLDDAAAWLDEIGLCLFLPRPAQLPAPAPSFVEAVTGAPSAVPPPQAIAQATELAIRLVAADRAIPLNLLGTFSEQPDFLVTPDVLPWVAAIRGDRQWKFAPAGRTAPIVVRTWAMLDQHGPLTAVEIRELLGRELTEGAVLRALIELWTTLRAVPAYAGDEPTRWSLLKTRFASQLTTAANTALPTALSALLSIYLRSAVAATAEEAEIFLSPLTARSRIREVLHGMTAARRFGTLSLGSRTLLFVEGSLPETPVETAPEAPHTATTPAPPVQHEKPAPRREFGDRRPPSRDKNAPRPWAKQRSDEPRGRRFQARGDDRPPRREDRPGAKFPRRDERPASGFQGREDRAERPRREDRPPRRDERPWQKDRGKSWGKPGSSRPRFERGDKRQSGFAPPRRKPGRPGYEGKPEFGRPPDRGARNGRPSGPAEFPQGDTRGRRENRPVGHAEPQRPFGKGKFGSRPPQRPRSDGPPRFGEGAAKDKPRFGQGKPRFGQGKGKPGFSRARGKSSRFGSGRPFPKARGKDLRQASSPRERKPGKDRSQEESSE
jgi:23S rRNA pseudouridine2605 synthase